MSTPTGDAIDFSAHIECYASNFSGRQWLFREIDRWLADRNGARAFLLTGEWGSGKTTFAARLCQFSRGLAQPTGLTRLTSNFLSAIHFCSVSNPRWNSPFAFAESLGIQLANLYPEYREVLLKARSDQSTNIKIEPIISVGENKGQVIGVSISNLELGGLSAEEAFLRIVLDPLEALCRQKPDEQIVILVDGLNEALRFNMQTNVASLLEGVAVLPPNVRFILTTRPQTALLGPIQRLKPERWALDVDPGAEDNRDDLIQYILSMLTIHPNLKEQIPSDFTPPGFAAAIADKSSNNFLYATLLLRDFINGRKSIGSQFLNEPPAELKDIYLSVLRESFTGSRWEERAAPLLGILAVAQEPLHESQLAEFAGLEADEARRFLQDLFSLVDVNASVQPSQRTYSIFSRAFAEFLLNGDQAEEFWLEPRRQHRQIVDYLFSLVPTT